MCGAAAISPRELWEENRTIDFSDGVAVELFQMV